MLGPMSGTVGSQCVDGYVSVYILLLNTYNKLISRCYYYPQITDKETQAQKD